MSEATTEPFKGQLVECLTNDGKCMDVSKLYGASIEISNFNPEIHHQNPIIQINEQFQSSSYDSKGHCVWLCMAMMVNHINPELANRMIRDMVESPSDHAWLLYKTNKKTNPGKQSGANLFLISIVMTVECKYQSVKPGQRIKGKILILIQL